MATKMTGVATFVGSDGAAAGGSEQLTPEEERVLIRDIALSAEANSKEGDTFYLITQRPLSISFLILQLICFCDVDFDFEACMIELVFTDGGNIGLIT